MKIFILVLEFKIIREHIYIFSPGQMEMRLLFKYFQIITFNKSTILSKRYFDNAEIFCSRTLVEQESYDVYKAINLSRCNTLKSWKAQNPS